MSSLNDFYVAVKEGIKNIRYSVGDKSKEHFSDLGIDAILLNAWCCQPRSLRGFRFKMRIQCVSS